MFLALTYHLQMNMDAPLDISPFVIEIKENEIEVVHFSQQITTAICLKVTEPSPEEVKKARRKANFMSLLKSDAFVRSPAPSWRVVYDPICVAD